MRVFLDTNVLVAALLSAEGPPARLIVAWRAGAFDLVVSPLLLEELRRALAYPKIRSRVPAADADAFVAWLERTAVRLEDPPATELDHGIPDPADAFLLALARHAQALLVTGDRALLESSGDLPIVAPADALRLVDG